MFNTMLNIMYHLRYGGNDICYMTRLKKTISQNPHGPKVPIVEETPF